MITAIIEKEDRVNSEDVRKIWFRDLKPEQAGKISEPFGIRLLEMVKSGIRAALRQDSYSAHQYVEHDNVNLLCPGAQIIGPSLA